MGNIKSIFSEKCQVVKIPPVSAISKKISGKVLKVRLKSKISPLVIFKKN